jgi:hypothetical protein
MTKVYLRHEPLNKRTQEYPVVAALNSKTPIDKRKFSEDICLQKDIIS